MSVETSRTHQQWVTAILRAVVVLSVLLVVSLLLVRVAGAVLEEESPDFNPMLQKLPERPPGVSTQKTIPGAGVASASPTCPPAWNLVPSPNGSTAQNDLHAIAALSPDNMWAVGYFSSVGVPSSTLVERWDGATWQIVSSPNPGQSGNRLYGVAAMSANDVWAVGSYSPQDGVEKTLAMHWNGTEWSTVSTPSPSYGELFSVYGVSPDDVWAVGEASIVSRKTLAMHWNGIEWSLVPTPDVGTAAICLCGVVGISPNDVWAVGGYFDGNGTHALLLHWDGQVWSVVQAPEPAGSSYSELRAVAADSATDVWAVGIYSASGAGSRTFITHWDGLTWSIVPSPTPPTSQNVNLYAVSVKAPNDAWAVGTYTSSSGRFTFVEHWDGATWQIVPSPRGNYLYGVTAVSAADVWAVGNAGTNNTVTFVERYSSYGPCEPTSTPTRFPTSTRMASSTALPATSTPGPICRQPGWEIVRSANNSYDHNELYGVEAVSNSDVWAVGAYRSSTGEDKALIEHWDGIEWSTVSSPNLVSVDNYLTWVSAVSANDVWAVGYTINSSTGRTLIEHWDGTQWSIVSSPNSGSHSNALLGVAAVAANDVWAVGYYLNSAAVARTLTLHWNGSAWAQVSSPNHGTQANQLWSISAVSASSVWAVGYVAGNAPSEAVALYWDGASWSERSPATQGLYAVDARTPDDVWAVGATLEHWDGFRWSLIPGSGLYRRSYTDVEALSRDNVWAAGVLYDEANNVSYTLMEHWDGTSWQNVASPSEGLNENLLYALVASPEGDLWSVGSFASGGPYRTLTLRRTEAIFRDVPVVNPFYSQVRCLVCRGIISGYSDGTFRPNSELTRGQLSKIVANSAGFTDPATAQTFEDVLPGSAFYDFVERLVARGIIGGYPCGAEGEPCGSLNRAYFRPASKTTRGQISKIVSNAREFSEPPGEQIFEDVPPGSPFFSWIQRLASRGAMSGYVCGGPGEPCGSLNRAYFRPGSNATRGQVSKIVANIFFPGCQIP